MGRSESIDTSHKQMLEVDPFDQYGIDKIQDREQLYTYKCAECEEMFNTKVKYAKHCGTCSTVANVLYVHYMRQAHRWTIEPMNPNPIVERVMTAAQPIKRLTH